ncbi:MAG: hypothetical protein C0402_14350 [Thermodesulfovibrio sp.]|nr:hypothetical protein [Thermodesulfovibrio sp.]
MAFTGELEHLHIIDIIQLLNTSRKSGTLTLKGQRGESRIIFSNGYIVSASHLNNKVRIGTVLVKMNLLSLEDLRLALDIQNNAGKNRKPLISTLLDMNKLGRDSAAKGLRKLIEITLVELVGWSSGTFTLDTEAIPVSPECRYFADTMDQEISLDAQMLLMDALRVFDERKRDLGSREADTPDEEFYEDLIPSEFPFHPTPEHLMPDSGRTAVLTADDLGLGELEQLERKIPEFMPVAEIFDPSAIHRQKIQETLSGFPEQEQEAFVAFLNKSTKSRGSLEVPQKHERQTKGIILFSGDELLRHSVMTICKDEGVLVFTTESDEEVDLLIDQCLKVKALTCLVFDVPAAGGEALIPERFQGLRRRLTGKYPQVTTVQMAPKKDYGFSLLSYREGVSAVFPRSSSEDSRETYIEDMINLLGTFKTYIHDLFLQHEVSFPNAADLQLVKLKDAIAAMKDLSEPSAVALALLQHLAGICSRCITFFVSGNELAGEKAIGVYAEKSEGPTSVTRLKVSLAEPSVFLKTVEETHCFYGESHDRLLIQLFEAIGEPLIPSVMLLPVSIRGKTAILAYGDFGMEEPPALNKDYIEVLAQAAGLAVENALYRKHAAQHPEA